MISPHYPHAIAIQRLAKESGKEATLIRSEIYHEDATLMIDFSYEKGKLYDLRATFVKDHVFLTAFPYNATHKDEKRLQELFTEELEKAREL